MHQPGASRHLKVLRSAGLVAVRRDRQRRCYRARFEPLQELDARLELHRRARDQEVGIAATLAEGHVVGLHHPLARLEPALDGQPPGETNPRSNA
jgi:DNA-binding transcriptional ArsR family regulator